MISFDVRYLQPQSLGEAVQAWQEEHAAGRQPRFLSGGTELVTMARDHRLRPGALIDLKRLSETTLLEPPLSGAVEARYGACLTLNRVVEAPAFPLLSAACARVADHSVRNSITLGGNVCGMLPYREAVLPLLVTGGSAVIAGPGGAGGAATRTVALESCFDKRLDLQPGEFLVAFTLPAANAAAPHWYRRRERDSRVDYPLLTLCAARIEGIVRIAFAGVFGYPLRSRTAEAALAAEGGSARDRAEAFVRALPGEPRSDMRASGDYRRELLVAAVADAIGQLEDRA